jgi:hypothetical protein
VESGILCDGVAHCDDGGDEEGCTSGFECRPGHFIMAHEVCDGRLDCPQPDDEADCPDFRCDDGGLITERRRCDGSDDCLDGSDELGCGQLFCN